MSEYVTLVANDGYRVVVSKKAASASGTLQSMLSEAFEEGVTGTITLHELDGPVLEKVAEYLCYNNKWATGGTSSGDIPDFPLPTAMALELLVAADFLHL
ncbi:elongin C [Pichia kluyveri]|uniref:Elongin-C n=1 Tax=Pichia kluyveri TaxID=36015 RepID=A0AAV5R0J9_PICKL|nr:elongin C [Pichia kluyveri]